MFSTLSNTFSVGTAGYTISLLPSVIKGLLNRTITLGVLKRLIRENTRAPLAIFILTLVAGFQGLDDVLSLFPKASQPFNGKVPLDDEIGAEVMKRRDGGQRMEVDLEKGMEYDLKVYDATLRTFMAGVTASGVSLLCLPENRRWELAMVVAVRASDSLMKSKSRRDKKWDVPYLEIIVYIGSCMEIMYSWFYL